ncbi:uncharacterized protein LOC129220117 isoform X2 [Uloborus diversus]|uniref:uncharacterized protein LOC129220117 isoform X2 n=1 Tax=Uloborus diversus TaxID=327109 RepID=UPI0024096565|nr:uncharacterized protein LOC129220117 isoform X2 [Uloborus diversus]
MRLKGCTLAGVTTLLICLLVPTQGRKLHHKSSFKHSHLERIHDSDKSEHHSKDKELFNFVSHHDDRECHKAALHKCGQTFLRAHKLLSYLDDDRVAFRTKCGVRTAFFDCLKTTREKICERQYKHYYKFEPDFRKKLTDTLWATRVCVLGVKSFRSL